jgi:2-pyrone-4,6-dicarboxylate lactonase
MTAETVEPRMPGAPRSLPAGACDTHTHVFGPFDRFPIAAGGSYLPPNAPPQTHQAMLDGAGLERAVIIQPAPYGTDNRALVEALRARPETTRGVAVLSAADPAALYPELAEAGVRGLRFNEMRDPKGGGRYKGSIGLEDYRRMAPAMREHGLVPHIWAKCADLAAELPAAMEEGGQAFVIDHLAGIDVAAGPSDPAFRTVLSLLREGRIWVKHSLCRNSTDAPGFESQRAFHEALLDANPDQVMWGSDWPFVRMYERSPDVGDLLDVFFAWTADEALRRRILVDNPQRLYGFGAAA